MFAPKWARELLGPLHYPWVLTVVFECFVNIRITDQMAFLCVHAPRGHIYLRFLLPPSSPQRRQPGYAALLRIRGNYFRPYISIPRVCHRGAAYRWKFSYNYSRHWITSDTLNYLFPATVSSHGHIISSTSPTQQKFAWRTDLLRNRSIGFPCPLT